MHKISSVYLPTSSMAKHRTLRFLLIACLLSLPLVVSAQTPGTADLTVGLGTLGDLISTFTKRIVAALAVLCLTMAVVAFFWGIVQYIWGLRAGDATKEKNGRNFMLWGLIALFVMFSVWGIIRYAQRIFSIEGQTTILIPDIQFMGGSKNRVNSNNSGLQIGSGGNGGSSGGGGTTRQSAAQQAYSSCVAQNGFTAQCQSAFVSSGGSGSGQQDLAQQAYNACTSNGNTSSECLPAYKQYGGTGTPRENSLNGACSSANLGASCGSGGKCDFNAYDGYYCSSSQSTDGTESSVDEDLDTIDQRNRDDLEAHDNDETSAAIRSFGCEDGFYPVGGFCTPNSETDPEEEF